MGRKPARRHTRACSNHAATVSATCRLQFCWGHQCSESLPSPELKGHQYPSDPSGVEPLKQFPSCAHDPSPAKPCCHLCRRATSTSLCRSHPSPSCIPEAAGIACCQQSIPPDTPDSLVLQGHQYPSGMEALQHANHVKRQTMTVAAVLGIAASQGVVDSLPRPVKAATTPVASVISTRAAAQAAAGKGPAPAQAASGSMPALAGSGMPQSLASAAGSVEPQSVAETPGAAALHSTPGADGGCQAQQQASAPLSGPAGPVPGQGLAPQQQQAAASQAGHTHEMPQQQAPAPQGGYMDAASQQGGSSMQRVPLTQNVHLAPLPAAGSWSQQAPVPMQQPASARPYLPAAAPPGPSAPVQQPPDAHPAT